MPFVSREDCSHQSYIISKKQLTTGFLNAPYANEESIAKHIRTQLPEVKPPRYECQEDNGCWMLAFDRMANAVFFGLQLVSDMEDKYYLGDIFKIGIVTGAFISMGPHKTTRMANYCGPTIS
jgi:hypothetical protein